MNPASDSKLYPLILSSALGTARAFVIQSLVFPLEVIKTQQQMPGNQERCYQVAGRLFRNEGIWSFYKGLRPQLAKTLIKHSICWPMITGFPPVLDRYRVQPLLQQCCIGVGIASFDAFILTPLEKRKVQSIVGTQTPISFKSIHSVLSHWRGMWLIWTKSFTGWSTFLVSQEYYRYKAREISGKQKLTIPQLMGIGGGVAITVSLVTAGFDVANTQKQAEKLISPEASGQKKQTFGFKNASPFFWKLGVRQMYRGWPMNALTLIAHNVASVILIDKLKESGKR